MTSSSDIFEDVLNLEEQYYREGYDLGVADGSKSGRMEGRVFGLEKGFGVFAEMGRLNGKAAVWEARQKCSPSGGDTRNEVTLHLPILTTTERLRKHIDRLAALTDPHDMSTENSEDAVSDVEDRLKDAKAKAALVARVVGEDESAEVDGQNAQSSDGQRRSLRVRRNEGTAAARRTGEMEDFAGLPGARS